MPRAKKTTEEAFGEVLREMRLSRGLSQEELAFACDRHRTYISLLERGNNSPSLKTLFRVAQALNTKPSLMLKRMEEMGVAVD